MATKSKQNPNDRVTIERGGKRTETSRRAFEKVWKGHGYSVVEGDQTAEATVPVAPDDGKTKTKTADS